jgi:type II secretory pathway component PulK
VKRWQSYNQTSARYRRDSTRHPHKKTARLFGLLGWLAICILPVFLVLGLYSGARLRTEFFRVAGADIVVGLISLGIAALFRPPTHAVRKLKDDCRWEKTERKLALFDKSRRMEGQEQSGTVLVLVLVVVALSSALILEAQVTALGHHRYGQAALDHVQLRLAAGDAIRHGMERLGADEDSRIDHLEEAWALPTREIDPSGIEVLIEIEDLNRYFDLNNLSIETRPAIRAPAAILSDILALCDVSNPRIRADALRDWIDSDEDGAWESVFYNSLSLPYSAANSLLYNWNELLHVEGYHREDFKAQTMESGRLPERGNLINSVTIIPVVRNVPIKVNVNTAARTVLEGVLGRNQRAALERILERREHRPILPEDVRQITLDPDLAQRLSAYAAVQSEYFQITARATKGDRSRFAHALVHRDTTGNVGILDWVQ